MMVKRVEKAPVLPACLLHLALASQVLLLSLRACIMLGRLHSAPTRAGVLLLLLRKQVAPLSG